MIVPGCCLDGPPVSEGWPILAEWDSHVLDVHVYGDDDDAATRRMMAYRIGHIGSLGPTDLGRLLQLCRPGSPARLAVGGVIATVLEGGVSVQLFGVLTPELVGALPDGPVKDRLAAALWVRAAQGLTP